MKAKTHFLVPEHIVLSAEEKAALLKQLNLSADKLPEIKRNDSSIKKMKPGKGDVVRIIRHSPTAGETIYYRVVI